MPKVYVSVSNEIIGVAHGKDWLLHHYIMIFFCLFSQHILKFSDMRWSIAVFISQHLVLPNLLGLCALGVRPGLLHVTSHTVPSDSDAKHPLHPLGNAPAQAEACLLQTYSISSHSPVHHGSVAHPPKTHPIGWWMDSWPHQHLYEKLDWGQRDTIIYLWGAWL